MEAATAEVTPEAAATSSDEPQQDLEDVAPVEPKAPAHLPSVAHPDVSTTEEEVESVFAGAEAWLKQAVAAHLPEYALARHRLSEAKDFVVKAIRRTAG